MTAPASACAQPHATEGRRRELFRESPLAVCRRVVLGTAWALRPKRVRNLLPLARLYLADLFAGKRELPESGSFAASDFVGIVHDLSVPTLQAAYARGLYPYGHFGWLKWASPAKRSVLFLEDVHISARLRSIMRQGRFTVTFDRDFEAVITACAAPRRGRWPLTWITPQIMRAYARFYDEGQVHSFEVWNQERVLVGGGYGVVTGRTFVTESLFFRESNASKIGFAVLAWHLAKWGFLLCDNKWATPAMASLGFRTLPRDRFLELLAENAANPREGAWNAEAGPEIVALWHPKKDGVSPRAA